MENPAYLNHIQDSALLYLQHTQHAKYVISTITKIDHSPEQFFDFFLNVNFLCSDHSSFQVA
jgi:hypothetical protein